MESERTYKGSFESNRKGIGTFMIKLLSRCFIQSIESAKKLSKI